jgi:hypothetical protein
MSEGLFSFHHIKPESINPTEAVTLMDLMQTWPADSALGTALLFILKETYAGKTVSIASTSLKE